MKNPTERRAWWGIGAGIHHSVREDVVVNAEVDGHGDSAVDPVTCVPLADGLVREGLVLHVLVEFDEPKDHQMGYKEEGHNAPSKAKVDLHCILPVFIRRNCLVCSVYVLHHIGTFVKSYILAAWTC